MSLSPYSVVVFSQDAGNVIPFAQIAIKIRNPDGTSGAYAPIYTTSSGTTPITQPGASADMRGTFVFYSDSDGLNVEYTVDGGLISQPIDVGLTADGSVDGEPLSNISKASKALNYENNNQKHIMTCIPRVNANGTVSFVDDVDHETLGFSSVEQVGDFRMRVNYSNTYTKVNALSITIDDELCKYGVHTGGSVGIAHSDFTAYTQLRGEIDTTTMTWNSTGLIPSDAVTVSYVDDVLVLTHDNASFNKDAVVVSQVYGLSFMTGYGVGQSASAINIIPYAPLQGNIIYNGTDFVLDPSKASNISSTQTGISYEWDGTVNALKVTHPLAQDHVVHVTPDFGGYTEINVEVTSLGSFRVYFFDSSGTQITTPSTGMKIMFSRPTCQVRGKIPTGAKFSVRAGVIPIRSANLGSASGNNFWVQGMMQF